jgi:AcrR family transcriptional regulator
MARPAVLLRKVGAADDGDMQLAQWATMPDGTAPEMRASVRAVTGGTWPPGRNGNRRATDHGTGRPVGRPRDAALDTAILRAAARQLAEQGYGGMSLGGVAAAAGTTPPSLRRRFRNKLDLALSAISALPTEPLPLTAGDPRADALASLENLQVNLARQNGGAILGALLAEERRHPELLQRFWQRIGEPARERLLQALAQGVRDGQLRPDLDLEAAVSLLIGSLYAGYQQPRSNPHDWAERILGVIWPSASSRENDPR